MTIRNGNQQKQQKSEELRPAIVLFGIVIAFFVCHVLRIVLNIEEIITYEDLSQTLKKASEIGIRCKGVQFWTMITTDVSHLLLQVNSSINFFIYCFFSKQFKKVLRMKLFRVAKMLHLQKLFLGWERGFDSRRNSVCQPTVPCSTRRGIVHNKIETTTKTSELQEHSKIINVCPGEDKITNTELEEMQSFCNLNE